jgi:hypothetical protein
MNVAINMKFPATFAGIIPHLISALSVKRVMEHTEKSTRLYCRSIWLKMGIVPQLSNFKTICRTVQALVLDYRQPDR